MCVLGGGGGGGGVSGGGKLNRREVGCGGKVVCVWGWGGGEGRRERICKLTRMPQRNRQAACWLKCG